MRLRPTLLVWIGFWLTFFVSSGSAQEIDFNREIRPILSAKCFFCHGPDEENRKAGLRLDQKESAFEARDGVTAIVPGNPKKSEAWQRILSSDPDELMPPSKAKKPLSFREIALLKRWIEEGADWAGHWSFEPPLKSKAQPVQSGNEIDYFVRQKLVKRGLKPSPAADRRTLIRRLSFDLTGLPPSPKEVGAFLSDHSPGAYERLVDRLLASSRFGERMALMWLDAARYGDTSVMHADGPRDMWPWRDWVIAAYNSNQPYDQFSIEQLAGDLLPNPSVSQLIATGFNRNHPSSDEGGAIAEELRVSYVADRVKTTSNVWLGLTMECGQCHEHKYDPVSQREYYQFYAFFNNTTDPGMQTRRGNEKPYIEVVSKSDESELRKIDQRIASAKPASDTSRNKSLVGYNDWIKKLSKDGEPPEGADVEFKNLKHYYPLDEPSGNLLVDVKGRKDAAGKVPIRSAPGQNDGSLMLDGATAYLVPDMPEYDNRSQLTFAAWVHIDSKFTGAVFSKMDKAMKFRGYDFWIEQGRPGVHLINTWPSNAVKVLTDQPIEMGQWQHIAITYDGSGKAGNIKIYVNGELRSHGVQHKAGHLKSTMKNKMPFRIGGRTGESFFKGKLDDVRIYDRALKQEEIKVAMTNATARALAVSLKKRKGEHHQILRENYLAQHGLPYRKARSELLLAQLERIALTTGKTTSMVMADNPPGQMRKTYLLERGAYDSPKEDEEILPDTPAFLPPLPTDTPKNRLALARWLFSPEHPLTSRVAVNHLWQLFFGSGIVTTPGDFGAQGAFPTHPKLLDWLATDFRESGWDVKSMIKKIVMSETYRQTSNVRPADLAADPENRFLARAPRFRFQAEMIRDNALSLSGLLVEKTGGPGVKPYQPPGLWSEVGLSGNPKFVQDHDDKLFRRSIYTYWKRSAPHPAMVIFDAPNRETCVLKRPNTNTPLQALAAMNDVQMIEASRHFAERACKKGGAADQIARFAFELATSRPPTEQELGALLDLYQRGCDIYQNDVEKAKALLSAGESKRDSSIDPAEHAAWTLVASLILNLDEVLTRN